MAITGLAGFLASVAMLRLGVGTMWLRYPLAVLVSWGCFLLLVRGWAETQRSAFHEDDENLFGPGQKGEKITVPELAPPGSGANSSGRDVLDAIPGDFTDLFDLEGGCLVGLISLLLIGATVGAIFALWGMVVQAEVLMAEVLLDTVLVSAFYRRLRTKAPEWWVHGALRYSARPVGLTIATLACAGILLGFYAPGARSVGEVWKHYRELHAPPLPTEVEAR